MKILDIDFLGVSSTTHYASDWLANERETKLQAMIRRVIFNSYILFCLYKPFAMGEKLLIDIESYMKPDVWKNI